MSKIFIYSDNESDVSWENVFLSTKYKDLKHFKKENPDLRPIVSYNVKDVIGVDVDELEQELAKLKEENENLQIFINRFQDEFYLKNSSSGLMLLYKDIVEYDLKQSLENNATEH